MNTGSDAVGYHCVQMRQWAMNSPVAFVDGIRVGKAWADAVKQDITPPVATFDPPNGN